ncbi:MAG: alpha/beta hydrolase [Oscillospiraceae bacterium]|nr:alpha/beta hydrolase [Oscillospiraceae bacterium]
MKHEVIHLKEHFPFLGEEGRDPLLTTYLPYNMPETNRQDQKRPAILLCPGGGYRHVSKREAEVVAVNFLPYGYNVYVLTYSISDDRFPTQLREAAAAMELIHANADEWNTDRERIAIMGFSAGGHLAGHYANCYDIPEVREVFPDSKPVQASVLCYPVITADPRYRHTGSFKNLTGHEELTAEDVEKYSLEKKVTENTPPAFLWHTRTDTTVPVMNSLLYAQALTEHNVPFAMHIYPAGRHGLSTVDEQSNDSLEPAAAHAHDWLDALMKWLKITL